MKKMNIAGKIRALVVTRLLIDEVFSIVIKDHPKIISQAIIQIVDNNPEIFEPIFKEMREKNASVQQED